VEIDPRSLQPHRGIVPFLEILALLCELLPVIASQAVPPKKTAIDLCARLILCALRGVEIELIDDDLRIELQALDVEVALRVARLR